MKVHLLYRLALIICIVFWYFPSISYAQNKSLLIPNIFGTWSSVKFEYYGYHKFDFNQAQKIKASKLYIGEHRFTYDSLAFIGPCDYDRLEFTKYDTTHFMGVYIEYIYTKNELSKLLNIEPVDKNGDPTCYNECSILFLKQDTLISICGGYTNYLIKEK